jgi:hypothetical protein
MHSNSHSYIEKSLPRPHSVFDFCLCGSTKHNLWVLRHCLCGGTSLAHESLTGSKPDFGHLH